LCNRRKILGYSANGCFAEFCNASLVHKLPENVSFKAGALTELLSCCIHGVLEQTGISVGDFVVITGPGPVGLFSALLAMAEGGIVILCGTSADTHRLNLAEDLGINYTFNIENEDVLNNIKEITQGYGADVVLECSGAAQAASMALKMVRKRGKYTQMGLFGKPIKLDFEQVAFKEIQLTGSISQRSFSWKRALHLMEQEKIPNERLISHEFSLANWESAFEMTGRGQGVKIIFTS
jgi:L-iditol 2-dehydrogenase